MVKYDLQYYEDRLRNGNNSSHMLKQWIDRLILKVYIPKNEQRPWTQDMLGYPIEDMPTKACCGRFQCGDYQMYLPDYNKYIGILGERKSIPDAYQTFLTGLDRFHREIDRYEIDDRFNTFLVVVEGTREEFMSYQPSFKGRKFNKEIWAKQSKGVQYNEANKRGVMNSLMARSVVIHFAGNREKAAKDFIDICKKWIKYHYIDILKIE